MKILYVTPQSPDLNSGGGRHCYANLRSLCEYKDAVVNYIGPTITAMDDFQRFNFSVIASRNFTGKDRFMAAVKGSSSSLIEVFSDAKGRMDFQSYDLVFIEFSYINFVFDYLPKDTPTICSVHNVEADYQNFNTTGLGRLKYFYTKNCEKKVVQLASYLLVMHEFDAQRLKNVYHTNLDNYYVHPVCSFAPHYHAVNVDERDNSILFAGSLNNRYNELGLLEFLKTCWVEIQDCGYTLLVAGRNPSEKLITALASYRNTQIFANPPDMELILRKSKIMILPDLFGTGMKLRVAEALSYGVPIVGTRFGLRGYGDVGSYGFALESIGDMKEIVLNLIENDHLLKELSVNALAAWNLKYSFESFRTRMHLMLDRL